MWRSREETPQLTGTARNTVGSADCFLFITCNVFQFVPTASLNAAHTTYTRLMRLIRADAWKDVFNLFFSSYAYIAAYFPVTNYMFADTHTGAGHHNVLLEMLNICEKLKSFVYFILCNLACFSICQCHTCRTIFQWPVLSFCKQEV